jgi:protein-S-isoprenylcysteine O-methyltransferase Ste14
MEQQTQSRLKLLVSALSRILAGVVLVGCMLFLPAGTLQFWEGWLYMALLFLPVTIVGSVLLIRDPELLERRMRLREEEAPQRAVIAGSSLLLLAIYLLAGFDRRYGWSTIPSIVVLLADLFVLLGYLLFVLTIRENRYASRVVEVQDEQTVVTTGPYVLVRHPMYLAVTVMFGLSPLALGSYWALIPALLLPIVLAGRVRGVLSASQVPPSTICLVVWKSAAKTIVVHTVTYFFVGSIAFTLVDYPSRFAEPGVNLLMRPTDDPTVTAGTLFQPIRGLLYSTFFIYSGTPSSLRRMAG